MIKELFKEEKKVEYIELIYDLIFVYIIGRSNSMLHHTEGGFISFETYLTFILATLIILQIWFFTTLFLNRYGTNSVFEYIGLFINMYLMYYMAQGAGSDWRSYYIQFNVAWGLILVNLAAQYCLKLRDCPGREPLLRRHIIYHIVLLLSEAAVVFLSIPLYQATGLALSPIAMAAGVVITMTVGNGISRDVPVDFTHLSERVMLYVVFTFGEMIICIAGYFEGGFSLNSVYFSLMGFLIVAGLFFIYGYYYNHVIDRESATNGLGYMLIHILLITMLNNITVALEFMRMPEVDEVKKHVMLVISFVLYFGFLMMTLRYSRDRAESRERFLVISGGLTLAFASLMAAFYRNSYISIAVTVIYIYAILLSNIIHGRWVKKANKR